MDFFNHNFIDSLPNSSFDFDSIKKVLEDIDNSKIKHMKGFINGMKVRHRISEFNDININGLIRRGTTWIGVYYKGYIIFNGKKYNNPKIFIKAHCRATTSKIKKIHPVEVEINGIWIPYKDLI